MSKYGIISCSYFPVFGVNTGKHGQEITPHFDIFHAMSVILDIGVTVQQKVRKKKNLF